VETVDAFEMAWLVRLLLVVDGGAIETERAMDVGDEFALELAGIDDLAVDDEADRILWRNSGVNSSKERA
jgi:hypothetical protein